jgi:Helix-turn-helix domain
MTLPEFLTPAEVAAILRVSPDTVTRHFEHRKGVIDLGSPEFRFKRRYRVLRIPREALEQFIIEKRVR